MSSILETFAKKRQRKKLSLDKMYSFLFLIFFHIFNQGSYTNARAHSLQNEFCRARETLVRVDKINHRYYPLVVKLHRCGGSCSFSPPSLKRCRPVTHKKIHVEVTDLMSNKKKYIYLRNETSCNCPCTSNERSCDSKTQKWNKDLCRCECKDGGQKFQRCQVPFEWDVSYCRCKCNQKCRKFQKLDPMTCTCECSRKLHRACARMNKYLKPDTCSCVQRGRIGKNTGMKECDNLPIKWIAAVTVMGFAMILILAFDCALYGKKTGLFHKVIHCCGKAYKQRSEERGKSLQLNVDET